ncbi:MAG: TIM-barrel domain-containing protein, partial [bacterium]
MTALTTRAERHTNPITVGEGARFTVIHPHCIRIEHSPQGTFVDEPSFFAIHREARCPDFQMTEDGGRIVIDTGAIRLSCRPDGKALGPRNLSARVRHGERWVEWKPGQRNRANLGGTAETLDGWTGARALEEGLLSRDGWYLLDDSTGPLQKDGWVSSRGERGSDWYLFGYGNDYRAAFQAFAAIAGKAPLPRRYTLGSWYSRYWAYTSEDYRQIVTEYAEKDFPLDMMVMDMDWHITHPREAFGPDAPAEGQVWTGFTWDRKLLPDAEALLKWFHKEGVHVTLNDHPADGVQPHEAMYSAFMRGMGADPKSKKTLPFDAGDRNYLETFYRHTHTPREKEGVDFWWLDWQQSPYTRSLRDVKNLAWLNHYYYRCAKQGGKRGQTFSRWGGWGDHRHPIHFSGDAGTGWDMLAFEVPFTATAGNVGCFFWSHDIGGHMGGRNEEAYTRWCQFGALSA